ncbi:polysaccharide pyruvyl transferase family protein [Neptunicella marina]|uniref:Polysaccharide pyruvyl transferase family protein n=1 Tax=Neptunicella marina TaxID=2125989 RepID=A0A8J6LW06_9ALTE|nr:polysaccharide pyruvyl transferase family protein [Neptunicella marina]MBC3764949.1 polysaccharide pyruvyl transferase family protein [Neptunicella marina]
MTNPSPKDVYLLSASDRFNYGDLLFPLVAKHELAKLGNYTFHNIATIDSDLTEVGAMPTQGFKTLLNPENIAKDSTLIIAGGQVLNADWARLVSYLDPLYYDLYEAFKGDRLENILKLHFGNGEVSLPFMPASPNILENMKIAYHAVGGGIPKSKALRDEVAPSFKQAGYLSVRETDAQRAIKNNFGLNASLVPDSVMVLSDMQPKHTLPKSLNKPYACAQFGFHKSEGKQKTILNQLRRIYRHQKLAIGLLSIGNCPGHDDQLMVDWIKKHADFPVHVLPCDTLDQITSAIANAAVYIGTSLHGVIVSMSYGNPFVPVNKAVKKVQAYTMTWAPEYLKGCVPFFQIAEATKLRMEAYKGYDDIVLKQKQMVRESFLKLHHVIEL